MVSIRELVNCAILNDGEWVGFFGDSEYKMDDGKIRMGYWSFVSILENFVDDVIGFNLVDGFYRELDDEISDDELTGNHLYIVKNDKGVVCCIKLMYDGLGI